MKLQNILFPTSGTSNESNMYFRWNEERDYIWHEGRITIHEKGWLDFDTYFNGFSAEKWYKYTNIESVRLTVKLKGCARLTLMRKEKVGDAVETEFIGSYPCQATDEEPQELTFPFNTFSQNGMYCFRIECMEKATEFYGGYYSADVPELSDIKLAIDICTFRREKYIEINLNLLNDRFLRNPNSELYDRLQVFVSDNAKTLDAVRLSSEKIHIFPNKNVGGSGGFTRGMIEIKRAGGFTNVLLMDDDILIEPETIFRTYALLVCLKEQYKGAFIGGAMLRLDHRNIEVEAGARWDGGNLISFKHGLNLNSLDACLYNEFYESPQFNAWWYCAIPMNIVTDDNLPLPMFIRGDDIEYGLRNMRHLILLNGICVWHEPFENKYSSFLFYYILRNRLIDNSIHDMTIPKKRFISLLKSQVAGQIRLYRYKNAHLLMRGVEDFLRGTEWLMTQDGEELHKNIMADGYKLQDIEDLDVSMIFPMYLNSIKARESVTFRHRLLRKLTMNGNILLPPKRAYNIIPTDGAKSINVWRTEKVLNYDFTSRKGFLTHRDPKEARRAMRCLRKLTALVNLKYDSAVKDYKENYRKLTGIEFWSRYLGLETRL